MRSATPCRTSPLALRYVCCSVCCSVHGHALVDVDFVGYTASVVSTPSSVLALATHCPVTDMCCVVVVVGGVLVCACQVIKSLRDAGFEVLEYRDLAPESEIPWYDPFEPKLTLKGFKTTPLGIKLTNISVKIMEVRGAGRGVVGAAVSSQGGGMRGFGTVHVGVCRVDWTLTVLPVCAMVCGRAAGCSSCDSLPRAPVRCTTTSRRAPSRCTRAALRTSSRPCTSSWRGSRRQPLPRAASSCIGVCC